MEIKELKISNFRGIKSLDWKINNRIVCLIGPGDSTKSTVLAAISLLFSPRWNVPITDVDFFDLKVDQTIEINGVITGFPIEFSQDSKFGLYHCFWNEKELVHVKEEPNDELALNIVFRVDKTLEPIWFVKNLNTEQEKSISASDRERLFVAELGFYAERDLSWGRYSGLTKVTGRKNTQSSSVALAEITRAARNSFESGRFVELKNALDGLREVLKGFGVEPKGELTPGLDPREMSINSGIITAHDSGIPLNVSGLGSRRLVTMAIYRSLAEDGAIFLIDEIETGFEPFRLRKLLNNLKESTTSQSFFTSHSVIPIIELAENGIFIVRNNAGNITINKLDKELVPFARVMPEALLSKVIIICEGKTEWGILRSVNSYWSKNKRELDFGTSGVEPSHHKNIGGSASHEQAEKLCKSGFITAFFGDSDRDTTPTFDELRQIGVGVFTWPDGLCTEQRICLDIPFEGLQELIELAISCGTERVNILRDINSQLKNIDEDMEEIDDLRTISDTELIRKILGNVVNSCKSFKENDHGILLGELLVKYLDQMKIKPTYITLNQLIEWTHEQSS